MLTEYTEAFFFNVRLCRASIFGISICPTIDFWQYFAIFKTY